MPTPSKTTAQTKGPTPVKAAESKAPAFNLDSLTPVAAPAPRRNDASAVSPKILDALKDSWANRTVISKAREAVPAADGKPAKPATEATELGDGRAFQGLPETALKVVEGQLRRGAAELKVGLSLRTDKNPDGTFTVRFAAKTLKQKRTTK